MNPPKSLFSVFTPLWASAFSAAVGAATWIYVAQVGRRREAWDNEIYFTTALPAIAFIVPDRPWRWAMLPFAAQALVGFAQNPTGSLLPLGLIMFAIFGGLCTIPAVIAEQMRKKIRS